MKRILVTGGAGFIGSNLCEKLVQDPKNYVICVDNFYSSSPENISNLKTYSNFEFIRHDITFPLYVEVDEIYHLACPASPIFYQRDPIQTTKTSILGSLNVLGLAKRVKAKVLLTSTSEVYGDPLVHPQPESYWGNVNTIGIRSCYTADTEILTSSGWKLFSDLTETDAVATLNPDSKNLEYHVPYEIISENYLGDIYTFKNWHIDISVTPNHKMYVKQRNSDNFVLKPAQEMTDFRQSSILKQCDWVGEDTEYFYFPEYTKNLPNCKIPIIDKYKMDDWLEFMGYYLTEGCTYVQHKIKTIKNKEYDTVSYRIQISQSQEKNPIIFEKIKSCLDRLGINYSISKSGNNYFVFHNKQIASYLIQFGKSKDKFIPNEFLCLSKRQLKILFDVMMDGDGTKKTSTKISHVYYSLSDKLIDNVQEMLLKLGYFGNIKTSKSRTVKYITCIESLHNRQYPKPIIESYSGTVHCVNVKNHIICVRRNGKVIFCGNCYDEGKRCAETLFFDYHRQHNVDIKVVRIFNTYGPNMATDDGRVVSNFICQALKGEDLSIYGDGSQTRSFQYVSDMVDVLIKMMASNETGPINTGNPEEFTMLELAVEVLAKIDTKSTIVYKDLPADDPKQRRPDITIAREKLNWEPKIKLNEGLLYTIDYFKTKV